MGTINSQLQIEPAARDIDGVTEPLVEVVTHLGTFWLRAVAARQLAEQLVTTADYAEAYVASLSDQGDAARLGRIPHQGQG